MIQEPNWQPLETIPKNGGIFISLEEPGTDKLVEGKYFRVLMYWDGEIFRYYCSDEMWLPNPIKWAPIPKLPKD